MLYHTIYIYIHIYVVLHYMMLYYVILYYIIRYYIVLYYMILYYVMLYYIILYYIITLYYVIQATGNRHVIKNVFREVSQIYIYIYIYIYICYDYIYIYIYIYILQRGVQWNQGVVICMPLYTSLLHNTTPIHCTPHPLHPPLQSIQRWPSTTTPSAPSGACRLSILLSLSLLLVLSLLSLLL